MKIESSIRIETESVESLDERVYRNYLYGESISGEGLQRASKERLYIQSVQSTWREALESASRTPIQSLQGECAIDSLSRRQSESFPLSLLIDIQREREKESLGQSTPRKKVSIERLYRRLLNRKSDNMCAAEGL